MRLKRLAIDLRYFGTLNRQVLILFYLLLLVGSGEATKELHIGSMFPMEAGSGGWFE
jgi:hypothetical protein